MQMSQLKISRIKIANCKIMSVFLRGRNHSFSPLCGLARFVLPSIRQLRASVGLRPSYYPEGLL